MNDSKLMSFEDFSSKLINDLRILKNSCGFTYQEIADFCGVDSRSVYNWCSGSSLPNAYCYYCLLRLFDAFI